MTGEEYCLLNRADRIWIAYAIRDSSLTESTKAEMMKKINNPIPIDVLRKMESKTL